MHFLFEFDQVPRSPSGDPSMLEFDLLHSTSTTIAYRVIPRSRQWSQQNQVYPNGLVYSLVPPDSLDSWHSHTDNLDTVNLVRTVFRQRVKPCDHCEAIHPTLTREERFLNSVEFTLCKSEALRSETLFRREGFQIPLGFSPLSEYLLPHGSQYHIFQQHIRPYLVTGPRVWTVPSIGNVWHNSSYAQPARIRDKCVDYGYAAAVACGVRRTVHSMLFRCPGQMYHSQRPLHDLLCATSPYEVDWIVECVASFIVDLTDCPILPVAVHNVIFRNQRAEQCRLRAHAILTRTPGPFVGFESFE